jgi:hypothetical protein
LDGMRLAQSSISLKCWNGAQQVDITKCVS